MDLFINIVKDAGIIIIVSALLSKIEDKDKYSPYRLLFAICLFLV